MFEKPSRNYILGGQNFYAGTFRIHNEDSIGNILWSRAYGTGAKKLSSMITTNDGGYIMFGSAYASDSDVDFHYGSSFDRDMWLLKLDSNGLKQWAKVYGGTGDDGGGDVMEIPGGGYYIVGSTTSNDYDCTGNNGGSDVYVARLNDTGKIIWHHDFGGTTGDGAQYSCLSRNGSVLISAIATSSDGNVNGHINPGAFNIWLLEVDSSGNIVWNNCYGGGGYEYAPGLCLAGDGSIWLAGTCKYKGRDIDTVYGQEDALFVHLDSVGNIISTKVMGSDRQDNGAMVHSLSNGSVIAGGNYDAGNGTFPNIHYGGFDDAFIVLFGPWTTGIPLQSHRDVSYIYPNPAGQTITISEHRKARRTIAIYDIVGKPYYQSPSNDLLELDISSWPRGLYVVKESFPDGQTKSQKLTLN
ncbi:MAG: T9SS C-terminal target domain-containing protein [Chitinophagia bacterium]|nr:T9SS C-terminal target domain-containing protein [Chitinophagia bacterium]